MSSDEIYSFPETYGRNFRPILCLSYTVKPTVKVPPCDNRTSNSLFDINSDAIPDNYSIQNFTENQIFPVSI